MMGGGRARRTWLQAHPRRFEPSLPRPLWPDTGQGLVEYGLILALVAIVCVISLVFFGDQLSSLLSLIASNV